MDGPRKSELCAYHKILAQQVAKVRLGDRVEPKTGSGTSGAAGVQSGFIGREAVGVLNPPFPWPAKHVSRPPKGHDGYLAIQFLGGTSFFTPFARFLKGSINEMCGKSLKGSQHSHRTRPLCLRKPSHCEFGSWSVLDRHSSHLLASPKSFWFTFGRALF